MAAATVWSFLVPDAGYFDRPELARILFFHLPCAITTSIFVLFTPYLAIRYLNAKTREWDLRVVAANEIGFLFGLLTMSTGIVFSKAEWGEWWSWDPRQWSFLLVLLLYSAYFSLRAALSDERKRADNSAAYAVATALPALFLIFVLPRMMANQSLHPSDTLPKMQLKGDYLNVFLAMLVLFAVLSAWLYKLRVRVGLAEIALENVNGNLEANGGSAAPTGVVRPVPVSRES